MRQLDATVDKVKLFFEENSIIFFQPRFEKNRVTVEFELPVKSFIEPGKLGENFSFELTIWEDNGRILDRIATKIKTNIPFHPNFARKPARDSLQDWLRYNVAVWVDYDASETAIDVRLKRMILSLQFNREYVRTADKLIGNEKALDWYLKEYHDNPSAFPTDDFLKKDSRVSPVPQPTEKKKFEVVSGETDTKKKFTIHKETSFTPAIQPLPEPIIDHSLNSLVDRKQSSSIIYISSLAKDQIFKHIQWRNLDAAETRLEQGGLLLGKVYHDNSRNIIYGMVEQGIPGESAHGTSTHLEMSHQTWSEMINKVDQLLKREEAKDLQIIGWYHTHPNHLDVFMSGTDLNTQRRYFYKDWHFAIVLNPQKGIWKAFSGAHAEECSGFIVSDESALPASIPTEDSLHRPASVQQDDPSNQDKQASLISKFSDASTKPLNLVLLFFVLLLAVFVIWSRRTDKHLANNAEKNKALAATPMVQKESVSTTTAVPVEKSSTTQPAASVAKSVMKLKEGTVLYNDRQEQLFEKPLPHSISVYGTPRSDGLSTIEVELFTHKEEVGFTKDSMLKLFENLHSSKSAKATNDSLVGKLIDTLLIQKKDYSKEGNWYKIKLTAVAK